MEQVVSDDDTAGAGSSGNARRVPERGTLGLPDAAWAEARHRAVVIAPLVERDAVRVPPARNAGRALGLSERTIHTLPRRWRQTGGPIASA